MSNKRPTASSWDSDDELLNEDSAGIYAFPTEKDEELDEDALLASDEEQEDVSMTHHEEAEESYEQPEPALEIMADGDDLLDEDQPFEDLSHSEQADLGYHDASEQGGDNYEESSQSNTYHDGTQQHYPVEEATFSNEDLDQSTLSADTTGFSQRDTSQEADTTVPDTDSESEGEDDKGRGRFKSERSDIVSLGSARSRTDIPDTLEITKEEEEKISKFFVNKNDNRPGRGQGRGQGQQNNRNQQRRQDNNNRHQNFQQRGPRHQFRPRGPRMNMRQQFPIRGPQLMLRNNAPPFNVIANQPTMMYPGANQQRFPSNNMPGQNIIGAPIMQQPLLNQQLQQQGLMGITGQPPQMPMLASHQNAPEMKIHVNPHFQTTTSRPPEVQAAWEPPQHSQGGPRPRGPSPRSTPQHPGTNFPSPRSMTPQHFGPRGPPARPDFNTQQRQFQIPPTSQPWNPQFTGEAPHMQMSTAQFSPSIRPNFPHSQEPKINQLPPGGQLPPQHHPQRIFSDRSPGPLQDTDERIPPPFISRSPFTSTSQLPPQATVQPMPPPTHDLRHNMPSTPVFDSVREQLQHGFQPKIYPHNHKQQGHFSHMADGEPEGQPIQTLVNKRMQSQNQGPVQHPGGPGQGPGPRGPRPGLAGPRPVLAGPRPRGPRPGLAGPRPGLMGPRPDTLRGQRPGLITSREQQQQNQRLQVPEEPSLVEESPKPALTSAQLEDIEKKRRRAARFSQPATVVVKKKITLGKRSSTEGLGPSPPKVLKIIKKAVVRTVLPAMQTETPSSSVEVDMDYDAEERSKMERQKQLAKLIKARKEKNRMEAAQKLSQKRAIKKIHGPILMTSTGQQPADIQNQNVQAPSVQPTVAAQGSALPPGVLNNVPVGGVARLSDGQWWKKVRVRDAKTGAIKTKFIKISAEEAQIIQANGPNISMGRGAVGRGAVRGKGRGNQTVGRGKSINPIERQLSQTNENPRLVNIPLTPTIPQQSNRVVNKPANPPLLGQQRQPNVGFNLKPITLPGSKSQTGTRANDRRQVKRPGQGPQQNLQRSVQPQRSINFNQSVSLEGADMPREQDADDKQRRVVLNGGGDAPAIITDTVMLSGISTGTNETSIRHLAQKVGAVAGCQIDRGNRKAMLQFRTTQHAGLFAQRFNRTMLDLAMISVSLVDPS